MTLYKIKKFTFENVEIDTLKKKKIALKFKGDGWASELFILLQYYKNNVQILSIFLVGEEERNIITKVKIEHNELLNKSYTDFLSWLQNNNLLQSYMPGSDEANTHTILGVEIRLASNLNIKNLIPTSENCEKIIQTIYKNQF